MKEQEEAPDCLGCPTHKAIRNYARTRFTALAREVALDLGRFEASGIFGDDYARRTLWDEYCQEVQEGPHGPLRYAFDAAIEPIVQAIVESIASSEAVLLTIGARWHLDEDHEEHGDVFATPDQIQRNLQDAIQKLAMSRNLSELDQSAEEGP